MPSAATGTFCPLFYIFIIRKRLQGAWGCLGGGGLREAVLHNGAGLFLRLATQWSYSL